MLKHGTTYYEAFRDTNGTLTIRQLGTEKEPLRVLQLPATVVDELLLPLFAPAVVPEPDKAPSPEPVYAPAPPARKRRATAK